MHGRLKNGDGRRRDERRRARLEAAGERKAVLADRLRRGEVVREHLEVAAWLGDEAALRAAGGAWEAPPMPFFVWPAQHALEAGPIGRPERARVGALIVDRVPSVFDRTFTLPSAAEQEAQQKILIAVLCGDPLPGLPPRPARSNPRRKDERRRARLEAAGEREGVLSGRLRRGDVSLEHLEVAAWLGDEAALRAAGSAWGAPPMPFFVWPAQHALEAGPIGRTERACAGALIAARVLPLFERAFPDDADPREAILAALRFADQPSARSVEEARAAAQRARQSSEFSRASDVVGWHVAQRAAGSAACALSNAAEAALDASLAVRADAGDHASEHEAQRRILIAVLCGDPLPGLPPRPARSNPRRRDERRRARLEAAGEREGVLSGRLRRGEVSLEHLEVAAWLGDDAAGRVARGRWEPDRPVPNWSSPATHALSHAPIRQTDVVRAAALIAARALPIFEAWVEDDRPREAVLAAMRYADDPRDENWDRVASRRQQREAVRAAMSYGSPEMYAAEAAFYAAQTAMSARVSAASSWAENVASASSRAVALWHGTGLRGAAMDKAKKNALADEREAQRLLLIAVLCGDPLVPVSPR